MNMLIKENFRDSITIPTRTKSSFEPVIAGPQPNLYPTSNGTYGAGPKNNNYLKGNLRTNDGVNYRKITNS